MDGFSLDPEVDGGGGSPSDTGGNPVDAAYEDLGEVDVPPASTVQPSATPITSWTPPSIADVLDYLTPSFDLPPNIQPQVRQPEFVQQPPFLSGEDNNVPVFETPSTVVAQVPVYYTNPIEQKPSPYGPLVGPTGEGEALATLNELFGMGSAQAGEAPKGSMNLGDVRRGAEAAAARGTLDDYLAQDPRRAEVINDKSWLDNLFGSYMSNLQEKNKTAIDAKNTSDTVPPSISGQPNATLDYTAPTNSYAYEPNANVGVVGLNGPYGLAPGELGNGVGPGNVVATMGFSDNTAAQPNVTLGYTAPTTGVQVGGSQNLVGQFTVGGPEAYRNGVSDPYGDYTPVGPDNTAAQPNVTLDYTTISPYTGPESEHESVLTDAERAALAQQQWTDAGRPGSPNDVPVDGQGLSENTLAALAAQNQQAANTIANVEAGLPLPFASESGRQTYSSFDTPEALPLKVNKPAIAPSGGAWNGPSFAGDGSGAGAASDTPEPLPLTVKKPAIAPSENAWTGPAPNLIGGGTSSDTAMSSTGYTKDTPTTSTEKLWSDLPFGTGSPIGADGDGISSAPPIDTTTPTVDTTPAVLAASPAFRRKYLGGVDDPYNYGFGAEHQYYGSEPAAAKGGMFNADQYFADGGLVQPLSPPMVPLVSAQPTMAFTDGVGAVGSIAQPPGMYQSDAYGSDAPHASPMAPSVAAAVPSFQPGLATLATPNVNASPTPSPIAQNPNVGYANGNSPLSNLTRS